MFHSSIYIYLIHRLKFKGKRKGIDARLSNMREVSQFVRERDREGERENEKEIQ